MGRLGRRWIPRDFAELEMPRISAFPILKVIGVGINRDVPISGSAPPPPPPAGKTRVSEFNSLFFRVPYGRLLVRM